MSSTPRIPSYRLHRASGQAVAILNGKSFYLGKYGSAESKAEYRRVIADWLVNLRQPLPQRPAPPAPSCELTVTELAVAYWRHVQCYYVKDGQPTSEQEPIRHAIRFLRRTHGHTRVVDFGPLALKAVREEMIRHPITRRVRVKDANGHLVEVDKVLRVGLARTLVNKHVGRLKRMFKWAVENELVPASVYQALAAVAGLRKDRTTAREKPPVRPVPEEDIQRVLAEVPPVISAVIRLQLLCGGRPQDVVEMRAGDIDRDGSLWEYRPGRHKSEHRGRDRVLYLGPRAQAVLTPYLEGLAPDAYVLSPRRAEPARQAERRQRRGGAANEAPLRTKTSHRLRNHYDSQSYRRAIRRACERLGVPVWFPLQLRHNAGTLIRKLYGLEASQAVLGHAELGVTQVYAEKHLELAREVMQEMG